MVQTASVYTDTKEKGPIDGGDDDTRGFPSPPHPLQLPPSPQPMTANSQLWSFVLTAHRMVRRPKRHIEKYATEESERIQGDVKGVDAWKVLP